MKKRNAVGGYKANATQRNLQPTLFVIKFSEPQGATQITTGYISAGA